jgi:hypothetical protein
MLVSWSLLEISVSSSSKGLTYNKTRRYLVSQCLFYQAIHVMLLLMSWGRPRFKIEWRGVLRTKDGRIELKQIRRRLSQQNMFHVES